MNTNNNNFVPLTDFVNEFCNSDEGKQLFAGLKAKKQADPARFELQYNLKISQEHLAIEANFSCAMHRFLALNEMRSDWDGDGFEQSDFDKLYEEYHDYVLAAARHVKAYRAQKKTLQQAILKQSKKRTV